MKITIDTQVDTYDDIKKVLHILTNILEQRSSGNGVGVSSNGYGSSNFDSARSNDSVDNNNLMNMFDNSGSSGMGSGVSNGLAEKKDTPPNFGSFLNLVDGNGAKKRDNSEPRITVF